MNKLRGCYATICLLFAACNGHVAPDAVVQNSDSAAGLNWYKRYTGTIADKPVVINLYQSVTPFSYDSMHVVKGNYYYMDQGKPIELLEDSRRGDTIILTEEVVLDRNYASTDTTAPKANKWQVVVSHNTIQGKWISADANKRYDINLKEDYTNAYGFTLLKKIDSSGFKGKHFVARELVDYTLCQPVAMNKVDADFLNKIILKKLETDTNSTVKGYIENDAHKSFDYYQSSMLSIDSNSASAEFAETNNWERTIEILPVYNDNGIVVLCKKWYEYMGGAHGNHGTYYICADVQQKRILQLTDIINVDTLQLSKLLETEIRPLFGLSAADKLNGILLVDTIPVTDNFAIANKGLIFHYNPYEIAPYAVGDVEVFLSYSKLKELLKESFKARIQF